MLLEGKERVRPYADSERGERGLALIIPWVRDA